MADRVSARRSTANAFFLTVNTTLVAVVGLIDQAVVPGLLSLVVCVAGIAVAVCWWFLLKNYRRLNEAKFTVINQIEAEHLPVTPFRDEWALLGSADAPSGRTAKVKVGLRQLGNVERIVPLVFALLYVIVLIGRLLPC